jgi:hypothetical protein
MYAGEASIAVVDDLLWAMATWNRNDWLQPRNDAHGSTSPVEKV